ncbi:hypothetical protein MMC14_009027, partial [Varicellaria rhodocarpa]|nr:hypothetical protein [Varicellaria rhodocarpa]
MSSPVDLSQTNETASSSLYSPFGIVHFTVVLIIISVLSIAFRFWARCVSVGSALGLDDWLALAALPLALTIDALVIRFRNRGIGNHANEVEPANLVWFLKALYGGQLIWTTGTSLVRFSVLAFYSRIFRVRTNPKRWWVTFYWIVTAAAVVWMLYILFFAAFFQCQPITKFWDVTESGKCIEPFTAFLIETVGILVVDLCILVLPIPQVFGLRITWRRKLAVTVSFLLGYGVAFMSVGRLIMSVQVGRKLNTDLTFWIVPYLYWDLAEISLSIMAVCLPAIFQLTRQTKRNGVRSLFRSKSQFFHAEIIPKRDGNSERLWQPDWNNIYEAPTFGSHAWADAGPVHSSYRSDDLTTQHDTINVRREVYITMTDMA